MAVTMCPKKLTALNVYRNFLKILLLGILDVKFRVLGNSRDSSLVCEEEPKSPRNFFVMKICCLVVHDGWSLDACVRMQLISRKYIFETAKFPRKKSKNKKNKESLVVHNGRPLAAYVRMRC